MFSNIEKIKSFESHTLVSDILSAYIRCTPTDIINCLVDNISGDAPGLLDYWAEINSVDQATILDAIEYSLKSIANFKFISTSTIYNSQTANTILRLSNDIIIPLEWVLS